MTSCKCLNPRFASRKGLAYSWTPSVHRPTRQRIWHHTVCGSKSRRKQTKDTSVSVQGGCDSEIPQGEQSGGDQSKSGEELSRSGKPIGWKVLPREDSPQTPVQQKVRSFSSRQLCFCTLCPQALVFFPCCPALDTATLHRSNCMSMKRPQHLEARYFGRAHPHLQSSAASHRCCEPGHPSSAQLLCTQTQPQWRGSSNVGTPANACQDPDA